MAAGREALEARVFAEEREANRTDRTIALLADDDFGRALVLCLRVVYLVAIDEHDHVGILLDRARIMAHDAVGHPTGGPRNRQIENLLLAGGVDRDHAIPVEIRRRPSCKLRIVLQSRTGLRRLAARREIEVSVSAMRGATRCCHGAMRDASPAHG